MSYMTGLRIFMGIFLLIMIPAWGYIAWRDYQEQKQFEDNGIVTDVTIQFTDVDCYDEDSCLYKVTYSYIVQGRQYTKEGELLIPDELYENYRDAQTARAYYLPHQPEESLLLDNKLSAMDMADTVKLLLFFTGVCGLAMSLHLEIQGKRKTSAEQFFYFVRPIFIYWAAVSYAVGLGEPLRELVDEKYLLAGIVGCVILLAYRIFRWYELAEYVKGLKTRFPRDVSDKQKPPPETEQDIVPTLQKLGFSRLGEYYQQTGDAAGIGWLFHNPDYTILAGVIKSPEGVQFSSWFKGPRLIETSFPFGERFDTPNYRCRLSEDGVKETYQLHLNEIAAVQRLYGKPAPINSVARSLTADKYYRENFIELRFERLLNLRQLDLIVSIGLLAYVVVFIFLYRSSLSNDALVVYTLATGLVVLIIHEIPGWLKHHNRKYWQ